MAVPYNLLPIEMHMAMITAEQANVAVLTDAVRMWTECREWIENARVELHTRLGDLNPEWQDDAGLAHEEKIERCLAELAMWGERIDAARPAETLVTLASAISEALQVVTSLHASYLAAISNPFTAWMAPGFQQASGARMTALGAQFDTSMLRVVAASGIQSPGDLMPSPEALAEGNSLADFIKAAEAGMTALTELESLATSVSSAGSPPSMPGPDNPNGSGLSLAGLSPESLPGSPASLGGLTPASGVPPVPTGAAGASGTTGVLAGVPIMAKPHPGKQTPGLPAEIKPGAAERAAAKPAGFPMMPPPMMSPHAGQGVAGTLRPGSAEYPIGRSDAGRPASGIDGVPPQLRGRSGKN